MLSILSKSTFIFYNSLDLQMSHTSLFRLKGTRMMEKVEDGKKEEETNLISKELYGC